MKYAHVTNDKTNKMEVKFMKHLKKMAVAVVATVLVLCCTTRTSAFANLAGQMIPLCGHSTTTVLVSSSNKTEEHPYTMTYFNGEELIHGATFWCNMTVNVSTYRTACVCGQNSKVETITTISHSDSYCLAR